MVVQSAASFVRSHKKYYICSVGNYSFFSNSEAIFKIG